MRGLAFSFVGSAAILASAGLALAPAASAPVKMATLAMPTVSSPATPEASVAAFPDCPAPAVNGMNIRTTKTPDGFGLTVFVVVQNVGHRAFFADAKPATLTLAMGGRQLAAFPVDRLGPSEVRFYAAETRLPLGRVSDDLVATLGFEPSVPVGAAPGTQDCQTSDNRAVRRAPSLQASLDRAAG
jgi:hypothetical protein